MLTGLGNGYTMEPVHHALLIGGGVGVPPLYNLCKCLRAAGQQVTVILGFNTADEVFYAEEFAALGAEVRITTVDGSVGTKGFVTDAFRQSTTTFIPAVRCRCCGRYMAVLPPPVSSPLRSAWAAALALVWAAPARPSTATSAFARTGRCW